MLKNEMHYVFKRLSGLPRSAGMEWAKYFDEMADARDTHVTECIQNKLKDAPADSPLPTSFQDAYYQANIPKILDIDMPGRNGSRTMKVMTSSRKGVTVSVELTPENMAHIFANINMKGTEPDTDEPKEMQDEHYAANEGDDEVVKMRLCNGKPTYRIQYRDSSGVWRTKSAQCQDGMDDILKERLMAFYAANHYPEGVPLPEVPPPCSQSKTCDAEAAEKAKHTQFWKKMKFLK